MSELQQVIAVTSEAAKQKMSIALTKVEIYLQKIGEESASLIFNDDPDNLKRIKDFLDKTREAEKKISSEHEIGKKPHLEAGRAWDNAKKELLGLISGIKDPVKSKYEAICNEIDRRNREEAQKKAKEKEIYDGVEANVLLFSQKIASCQSKQELNDIERLINLEKSSNRSAKYGEWHQEAISRYNEVLIPIIKDQKTKIDEKEQLENQLNLENDPEKYDEIKQRLDEKQNEIIQNKVKVQENALSQSTEIIEAETISTTVKAERTDIVPEIVDLELLFKKRRELLNIDLKVAEAKKIGKTLELAGEFDNKDELIVDGIKFTIKKSW